MPAMTPAERIIVALDISDGDQAQRAIEGLAAHVGGFKIGYQLGYSIGWAQACALVRDAGGRVFLDAKLADTPNTMAGGVRALSRLNPWMIDVHASAGVGSMRAAVENKDDALLLAVTVLTSLSDADCELTFGARPDAAVTRFARMALEAGVDGLICSPQELELLAAEPDFDSLLRVTPGVRPTWASHDDQQRVMTPAQAARQRADYLVIGRPIMQPPQTVGSPVQAAKRIADEIASAL